MKNNTSLLGTTGKFFFIILGLSLGPVLITCISLYYFDYRETKNRNNELAEQNTYFQVQNLNDLLSEIRIDLHLLADIAETKPHDQAWIEQLMDNYVNSTDTIYGAAAVDLQGNIFSRSGQTPAHETISQQTKELESLHRKDNYSYLSLTNTHQWNLVMVQKLTADTGTKLLKIFIPLQRLLPVRSLPGTFPPRWSALLDPQGSLLSTGGSVTVDKEVYQEFASLSFKRERLVQTDIIVNESDLRIFMIPVAQNLMALGLAYDLQDFKAGRRPLAETIFFLVAGWFLILLCISYLIARRGAAYLAHREVRLQAMNEQVVEAGKMASIGELASGIAHEINNPVAIMVEEAGWMQDLLEEETELAKAKNFEELERSLKQIRTQGLRCKDITHKLLSFARKSDSRIQDIDLNALTEEIAAISEKRARYAGIKLTMNLDPLVPPIPASSTEMQQVFLNIINNAIDVMEKTGGELEITSRIDAEGIHFFFRDTGEGIPKANLAKIFDPFFTTKPVGKGTGLGLSICYAIIQNLGGTIIVTSETGVGTTFHIQLPPPATSKPETTLE